MVKWWRSRKKRQWQEKYSRGFGAAFSATLLHGHDIKELEASVSGSGVAFDLGVKEGLRHIRRYNFLEESQDLKR